ncbi:MAG: pantetheine-phosphate adenylyltransferase [Candidatus Hermodarchaeota archaeon]
MWCFLIFNKLGMGGSFDHLHEGHKYLIKIALSLSRKVIIGLTTQSLLKNKKFPSKIENYKTREENLKEFIKTFTDISRVEIIPLEDPYGPPIHEPDYESIIVSQETYNTALKINEIRESKGFSPLILIVIPIIKDYKNQKISSTAIREQLM